MSDLRCDGVMHLHLLLLRVKLIMRPSLSDLQISDPCGGRPVEVGSIQEISTQANVTNHVVNDSSIFTVASLTFSVTKINK